MEYQLIVYRLYGIWSGMMQRCNNPKNPGYKNYGGRGISVCYEWRNDPKQFIEDMYPSYVKGLTIDRIDNNGNYQPNNCRFVTNQENVNNREITFIIDYNGQKIPFMDLMRIKNIDEMHYMTIRRRIKRGWNHNKAIDTPIKNGNYKNRFNTKINC